ncbi:hypothetical protein [Dokdonella sp.]|uniref:hypothetical protein n=1 Tax=Dokdonella sp. TaxID=2291710 RepID=UPI00352800DC
MSIWLMVAAIAFGTESLLAATTPAPAKNPLKSVLAPEALALGELELPQSAGVSELDRLVGVDLPGAFEGERCDELESTIEEQLRLDPSSLSASYFKALCTGSEQSILEYRQTSNDLDLKFKQAELPAGEYFGDTVISVSSFLDIGVFNVWHGYEVLAGYYDIAGGGRRLYFVSIVRDPESGRESRIHFDLTRVATELGQVISSEVSAPIRQAIEDSPAAALVGAFVSQAVADPATLTGLASFSANLPDGSWESPEILELLEKAAAMEDSYARILLARALLLKESLPVSAMPSHSPPKLRNPVVWPIWFCMPCLKCTGGRRSKKARRVEERRTSAWCRACPL